MSAGTATAECDRSLSLLSPEELAQILGVHRVTVHRYRQRGAVPSPLKIGGSVRWRRAEIEAWIGAGCPSPRKWEWEGGGQ